MKMILLISLLGIIASVFAVVPTTDTYQKLSDIETTGAYAAQIPDYLSQINIAKAQQTSMQDSMAQGGW